MQIHILLSTICNTEQLQRLRTLVSQGFLFNKCLLFRNFTEFTLAFWGLIHTNRTEQSLTEECKIEFHLTAISIKAELPNNSKQC